MAWSLSPVVIMTLLFALLVSVAASPVVDKADTGNTFSVPLAHNADIPRHGPTEHLRTLKKYNLEIPQGLQEVVDKHHAKTNMLAATDDGGAVPAISLDGDLMWLAPVNIGTPRQQLYLDLDTGSSDTWVFSTETSKTEVQGQTLWDPSKSSTSALIDGCSWSILYGDWSTSEGTCYTDTFALGNLSIPNMTIESATFVSSMFSSDSNVSGLVGLGWPALKQTTPPQKALIEFLADVLDEPVFTVDFRHNSSDGSFNFGYIDGQLHEPDIVYTNVDTSDGFWGVKNTAFGIGGENLTYSFLTPKNVIVDTGTTLLYAPEASVDTYFSKVPGANFSEQEFGYVVPCDAELPDFLWEISDDAGNAVKGAIPGAYLIYAHTDDQMCFAGLQSMDSFSGVDGILGDIFLKSAFFIFDIKQKRLGIAPKHLNISNGKRYEHQPANTKKGDK
ncbi:secreted aspartic proteinase precursor [Xylariaceae sp. FL1651]|nr:secreted aspartic proteinase precursor [Xylariaceae sp. FL1651]